MTKYFLILLSILFTSMFYFPFEFTFLIGINTKHILALLGSVCLGWDIISNRYLMISKELLVSSIIAIIFSIIVYYSTVYNNTSDYAYSFYLGSMWVWYLACYGVCVVIRVTHGYISMKLILFYLTIVCVSQCILALSIDFIPAFKRVVDSLFVTGDLAFMEKTRRLYGIGALLDVAGIRFAAVLVLIAVYLSDDYKIQTNSRARFCLIIAFLIITVIGNMIARTTSVGMLLGGAYILFYSGLFSLVIKAANLQFWKTLVIVLAISVTVLTYLYKTNNDIYILLRFAFEGFFNFVETGEWETNSTEVLQTMWRFPTSMKTWIIGDGYFNDPISGSFYMLTDVGYLRFIYYCGVIGLFVFCLFFIYLSIAFAQRFNYVRNIFILFLILVFVNWVKVATDIFLMYAFFLVISQPYFSNSYKQDFEKI